MKTRGNRIEWFLGVLILTWPVQAQYGGGTGEPNDPYLIYTPEQMNQIGLHGGRHFKLMADIDLSAYTATEFNIIGYYRNQQDRESFHGVFDGNGHTISNFTYVSQSAKTVGIFDTISGELAEVRDLGLIDPNVHAEAGSAITALVSYLEGGTIRNCYVRGGSVTGGNVVAGLVGYNYMGSIVNCYASIGVSGDNYVGGLVGKNLAGSRSDASTVANCYSTSSVSGNEHVGGLLGSNLGIVFNCFWDVETSGQEASPGGIGRSTAEMQTNKTFLGWGAAGNEGIWTIDDGNDYPRLSWENQPGSPIEPSQLSDVLAGAGSQADPFLIYTAEELNTIGLFPSDWDKYFKLMTNIDLGSYTGMEFNMIGNIIACYDCPPFTGIFDGCGHTIANFSCGAVGSGSHATGLFARIDDPNAEIRNLRLVDPNVNANGRSLVGSLIGRIRSGSLVNCHAEGGNVLSYGGSMGGLVGGSGGTIADCSSSVIVEGGDSVGGVAGSNSGRIVSSYSSGSVSGRSYIGGLVGQSSGVLADCYATSAVSGNKDVGGLVGLLVGMDGTEVAITDCYSSGSVSASQTGAGLVGEAYSGGSASACFWDTETSGQLTGFHGTGKTTAEMQTAATFLEAGWDFVGETANGTEDIWWILEGRDYPRLWWEASN